MNTRRSAPPARVILVDEDPRYSEWLRHHLDVVCPQASVNLLNVKEFGKWLKSFSGRDCDLLLLVSSFGDGDERNAPGLQLLRRLREQPASPAVMVIAEDGNELTAVRALQIGAVDYLPKRLLTPERLGTAVRVALRRVERRVQRRLSSLAKVARENQRQAVRESSGPPPESEAAQTPLAPEGIAALLTAASSEVIPGYTLRLKIGESEKAVVYLATSLARGHNVALKISKTLRDEAAGKQFLEREYTAIQAVKSPLVVEIYDYGVHAGFEYLAMEYLPRGDLKARIQRGVNEQDALYFVGQIAAALEVVHAAGLVHRDLKPPNVMLRENEAVALIDFGLARSLDGSTANTQTGVLLGSPYYMSPEQALGEPLDARSDFYSLGVILYEMLIGQKLYLGTTAMEVLQQHVSAPAPVLPQDLGRYQELLSKLLAKSREERFASAGQIVAAITALRSTLTDLQAHAPSQPSAA
jgi:eukaryotic-like serine/threonine-protein kinase